MKLATDKAVKEISDKLKAPRQPSAAQLIKKYLECRRDIATLTARYEKEILPYRNGMDLIESLLADEINRLEGQSIKTDQGTAYRSTITSYKVADRDMWFNWVFDNNMRDMLTANVAKEAVKEFADNHSGKTPPGLNVAQIYKINIRSADQ
jgi:hypothetical protein